MQGLVELVGLSRSYGALKVTDNVTLGIPRGEALGIVGPNGAGKTTLFNLITGTVAPSSGRVIWRGQDITALSAASRCRAGIARSFQVPQPFAGMTVYENVLTAAIFGAGLTARAARARTRDVLEATELADRASRLAGALPLLDRKRMELSRALATNPDLLLLDEIAGGLTDQECTALIALIRSINRDHGVTVVWIEHVVHALLAVVTRLVVLDQGRVVMDGDPHTVMASDLVRRLYTGLSDD
ncbi:ABC transporter ATP-binding protein [Neotabrizicola shimadae]|uniref:ABC transporter ATP-binding protein n=1 Tax=Neotabrizicola shimadae TaxID=2807096 RepID=A0A8G0ZSD9_9RHOB|nr:ABC transporter ATP-binding protein [Neotabrizicola shimadae]QYZ69589.1 ABC transporter ATP-binding protein [Neotabrizicola shimadae]